MPTDSSQDIEKRDDKLWRWGKPYQYPIPEPNGDHWKIVLEPLLKKDKIRCEAWKDEVQNLLIFAGLFSAVVTGFAIESYKGLQSDPNATATLVLVHIANRLDFLSNNTTAAATSASLLQYPSSFSPSPSSIRINAFWFMSLVLSLSTVLIGIVSLQWIREHQRYAEPLTPKEMLAIFHMRAKALDEWRIPQIFTCLPLLLQAAVILFFVGVSDFLFTLQLAVAIPVTILIGITIIFLAGTTTLPTLQCFSIMQMPYLSGREFVPSQCPYKSPQSWAFRAFSIAILRLLTMFGLSWNKLKLLFQRVDAIRCRMSRVLGMKPTSASVIQSVITSDFCLRHNHRDWIDVDMSWLSIRDARFLATCGVSTVVLDDSFRPPYDLVQVIASTVEEQSAKQEIVLAGYQCFRELSHIITDEADAIRDAIRTDPSAETNSHDGIDDTALEHARILNLQSCFSDFRELNTISSSFTTLDIRLTHYENMFLFLELPGIQKYSKDSTNLIGMHRIELHTRIWVFIFFNRPENHSDAVKVARNHPFLSETECLRLLRDVPIKLLEDVTRQHYQILEWIFTQATNIGPNDSPNEIIGYAMFEDFVAYIAWFRPPKALESKFVLVLDVLMRGLTLALESREYDPTDFLFFCGRLYLERIAQQTWLSELVRFGSFRVRNHVVKLLQTMRQYEVQLDKSGYSNLVECWRNERRQSYGNRRVRGHTVGFAYEPITENVLRFIPYDS